MRCMTAICPAGPPKLRSATRTQVRVASFNDGYEIDSVLPSKVDLAGASFISLPRLIGWPVVCLVHRIAGPTIQGVIEQHPSFELFQVVRIHAGEAKRCREQAGSLWRQFRTGSVCSSNHCRQTKKS